MRRLALLVATLLALLAARPAPTAGAQVVVEPRTIQTTGEATVYVVPDEVIVRIGVVTANADLAEAKRQSEASVSALLGAVQGVGIEEQHVQANDLTVEIDYKSGGPVEGIDGYIVRRSFAVTLKSPDKLGQLIDAALSNGANVLEGVEYRSTELRKHRDEARRLAAEAAKEKARDLARVYGMQIGLPRTINEGNIGYWGGSWSRGYASMSQNVAQYAGDQPMTAGETIPLGQIGITASVTVRFDMGER